MYIASTIYVELLASQIFGENAIGKTFTWQFEY